VVGLSSIPPLPPGYATIIQHYLPNLINLNNYVLIDAVNQKKINQQLLNRKPLAQLGLNLPKSIIKNLSNGKSGTIDIVLFKLRNKIDREIAIRQKIKSKSISSSSSISLNNINSNNDKQSISNRSIVNLSNKWVSRLCYEELNQQCLQFQEQIQILEAKIRRLEHSIQIKDIQFNELSNII
jgi:hypothetical protein